MIILLLTSCAEDRGARIIYASDSLALKTTTTTNKTMPAEQKKVPVELKVATISRPSELFIDRR